MGSKFLFQALLLTVTADMAERFSQNPLLGALPNGAQCLIVLNMANIIQAEAALMLHQDTAKVSYLYSDFYLEIGGGIKVCGYEYLCYKGSL